MLICILCGRIVIFNENPVRYCVCTHCDPIDLRPVEQSFIRKGEILTETVEAIGSLSRDIREANLKQRRMVKRILRIEVCQCV